MSEIYHLTVNGVSHNVAVDYSDAPLLYILRDDLNLKGTKFGCGNGGCGACTVLVNGRAEKSCQLPIWSVENASITTIEGLGDTGNLHPIQQAIIEFQAGQCGYCLPGIIMAADELIASDRAPSRERIAARLTSNLCRCGSHGRIIRAIESAWRQVAGRGG